MTSIFIPPFRAKGEVPAPASKSDLHRLLILAALRDKQTEVCNLNLCGDVQATVDCLRELGANIEIDGSAALVTPIGFLRRGEAGEFPLLDARESGSTLRFLLPVACALYPHVRFTARGGLLTRPIGGILKCLKAHGVSFSSDTLPFETSGLLRAGTYEIDGSLSSQYVSGLMMASVITGGSVKITGQTVSAPYIELTKRRIEAFKTGAASFTAEGDWSAAAALLCLPGEVTVSGLDPASPQADRAISDALKISGAEISWNGDSVTVKNTDPKPFPFDVSDCPDLAPCLAVLMAASEATCTLTGCRRLIYKESNRAEAIVHMINALGGAAAFDGDTITVRGPLAGGKIKTFSDHRIAMAGCVAAAWSENGAEIDDTDCVNKSCPDFWVLTDSLRS